MLSVTVTVERMHAGYYRYVHVNAILETLQTYNNQIQKYNITKYKTT